jgi:hypothetical protein
MVAQAPETGLVKDFVQFFESLKGLGIEVDIDENWRTVMVKGELKYMDFSGLGYNIEIGVRDMIVSCSGSRDSVSISVWKFEDGRQVLLKKIWVEGTLLVSYSSPHLMITYINISELSELIELPDRVNEMINAIRKAGFGVRHFPKKREIRIKGKIERVTTFGTPRPLISLRNGDSIVSYEYDGKDHNIVVTNGNDTTYYKIGEGEEVSVRVENQYLIIRYSVV